MHIEVLEHAIAPSELRDGFEGFCMMLGLMVLICSLL
jgi:hypothetical protein